MENNMLRVAEIGMGGISGCHYPVWKEMEDVKVVAICDVRPEQMEGYEGVNKYTDFDDLLANEEIDILDITLPTYLHAEYAIKAMERGIHVICEKPISLNRDDVKRVYDTAAKMGVNFMIAHVLRFWDEYVMLKEIYDTGKYGKLLSGSMERIGQIPKWSWDNWMKDENRSGLVPFDLHIHDLDFLVYAFGNPKSKSSFRSKRPDQDYFCVTYDYGDFFVNTQASWYASPYPFRATFRFQFEGAVVANEGKGLVIYEAESGNVLRASAEAGESGVINIPTTNAYANEIHYFADCVRNNVFPDKVKAPELEEVIDILKSI